MHNRSWQRLVVSAGALVAIMLLLGDIAIVTAQKKDPKKDPKKKDPDLTRYLKQLHAKFDAWDTVKDNVLDKSELAKAFRGPKAKPYDYEVAIGSTSVKKVRPISVFLAAMPRPGLPVNLAAAEILCEKTKPTKIVPPINVNTLGDYQFLVVVGSKGKDRITKQEFDGWAKKYARMVDDREDAEREIKEAKARLAKAKTPQQKKQADADLRRHTQDYDNATRQLLAIPAAIHKALNILKP
jgi:hypothetical protein